MAHPIVVAVRGPSGSGKTTAVAELSRKRGWATLDEAFYRLRPRPGLRFASQGELRMLELRLLEEEARRYADARALAARGRPVVADTGFLDPVEYTAGLLLLGLATPATFRSVVRRARSLAVRRRLGVADLTVHLSVTPRARAARTAADPAGHPRVFRARHESVGRVVSRDLIPSLGRVVPGHVRVVRAVGPPRTVSARIETLARRTGPLRDGAASAVRWLDALLSLPAVRASLAGRPPGRSGRPPSPKPRRALRPSSARSRGRGPRRG